MATHLIDVGNNTVSGTTIAPVALTTVGSPVTGTAIDCVSVVGPISALLSCGVFTAPGTLNVKLQEAVEDPESLGNPLASDWSDVTGGAFAQVTASAAKEWLLAKNLTKRFVRAHATIAGGGASVLATVELIGQKKIVGSTAGAGGYSNSPAV